MAHPVRLWTGRVAVALRGARRRALALAARAEAFVYWSERADTIGRPPRRHRRQRDHLTTEPQGVAVDGAHVYWAPNARARSAAPTSTAPASTRASSPAPPAPGAWRSTAPTSTGRTPGPTGHDRARQPRRHRRQPELHHRRRLPPPGWRSTPPTSTGRTAGTTRSGAPTSTAPASTRASSPAPASPPGRRGRRRPRLLGELGTGTIGRANLDGTAPTRASSPAPATPSGVAVDGAHIYWANGSQLDTIGRANLDGTGVNQSFIGTPQPHRGGGRCPHCGGPGTRAGPGDDHRTGRRRPARRTAAGPRAQPDGQAQRRAAKARRGKPSRGLWQPRRIRPRG